MSPFAVFAWCIFAVAIAAALPFAFSRRKIEIGRNAAGEVVPISTSPPMRFENIKREPLARRKHFGTRT